MADAIRVMTAEGRLINSSLFERDVYKDEKGRESKPEYRVELAFDSEDDIKELEDAIIDAAIAEWGDEAEGWYLDDGTIDSPIKDGDELANAREARGKPGEAYRGKFIIRAHTEFNEYGDSASGGIYVAGPDAEKIDFADRGTIYNGCYGVAVVQPSAYSISGRKGVTLYLQGFQKTRDGDPLRGTGVSGLFKPAMGQGSEGKGRRRRGS